MARQRDTLILGTGLAAGIGALDGVAASRDTNQGRSWNSPGLGSGGGFMLSWGWGPLVQVAAVALGAVGSVRGSSWGDGTLCAGAALMSRSVAFRLMQNKPGATPMPTQAMVSRAYSPNDRMGGTDQALIMGATTNRAPGDSPGNGYIGSGAGVRFSSSALGPVTAQGWSGVPGQYGDPTIIQKAQAPGLL